uniref:ATP synthase complex subunit 8 n=1 Tax=Littorina brevicula TaxID=45748 RepID=A0A7L7YVF4_9CAEN|nr:ATP synthase F0 subunit 8 [Littorina brevicula]QOD40600.1 ATP synthase F0 subunit 8 [Littorina brevicula]ULR86924.1 ATP synthase F0 subunit 8 [Littorina brevicula]UOH96713.1 ATP synthase F0 subunit 8 [Littorina brevicula]
MPQLSPLNWIFLFIIFWAAVLSMSILIWWSNKIYFSSKTSEVTVMKENKWNW